jgi:hypothetical protein
VVVEYTNQTPFFFFFAVATAALIERPARQIFEDKSAVQRILRQREAKELEDVRVIQSREQITVALEEHLIVLWRRSQSRDDGKERKIRWHWN